MTCVGKKFSRSGAFWPPERVFYLSDIKPGEKRICCNFISLLFNIVPDMTINEFNELNELDQVSAIMQYGRLMAQNIEDECRVFLYRVETFYVSATYSRPNDLLTGIVCYLEVNQEIPHSQKKLLSIHPAERNYQTPEA
jgi:hypothetical protein